MNNNKLAWQTRRFNQDKKGFISLFIIAFVFAGVLSLLSPSVVISAESNDLLIRQNVLPVNQSKEKLTIQDRINIIAKQENFQYTDYLHRLIFCESRYNQYATNDNGKYGKDRGLAQINTKYHPEVSDEQAFNPDFAIKWTIGMINKGEQHQWACDRIVKGKFNYIADNK